MEQYIIAGFLGVIEGLAEFLPISSTGHLILFVDLLNFKAPKGRTFEVMIQLGPILALVVLYFPKLWATLVGLPSEKQAQRFALLITVAFLPAMVLGAIFGSMIKAQLFYPTVVASSLIVGGVIMLVVEQLSKRILYNGVDDVPLQTGFWVGVAQCVAMIPGVSRSGATIVGGLLLGLERRTAAEFSFFLAIPTMSGAFVYDLFKHWNEFKYDDVGLIATGFIMAFISGLLVVRPFLAVVSKIGFA
ncbi:MAG: undecaprenyl-diphosphate phosphatase, partial [Alphaproteobacteria bacterium]